MSPGGGRARRSARGRRGARDSWSSVATPGVAPIVAALDGHEQRRAVMVLATLRLVERWGDHPPWRLLTRTAEGRPGALWCDRYRARWACPARRLATRFRQPGRAECRRLDLLCLSAVLPPNGNSPPHAPASYSLSRANSCNGLHQIRPARRLEKATSSGQSRSRLSANSTSGTQNSKELAKLR